MWLHLPGLELQDQGRLDTVLPYLVSDSLHDVSSGNIICRKRGNPGRDYPDDDSLCRFSVRHRTSLQRNSNELHKYG